MPTIGSVNPVTPLYATPINGPKLNWFLGGSICWISPLPLIVIPPKYVSSIYETNLSLSSFSIFGDKMKAIELCVARFDDDTKESFLNLYTKIDAGVTVDSLNSDTQTQVEEDEKEPEEEDAVSTI